MKCRPKKPRWGAKVYPANRQLGSLMCKRDSADRRSSTILAEGSCCVPRSDSRGETTARAFSGTAVRDRTAFLVSSSICIAHLSCDVYCVTSNRTLWGEGLGESTTCRDSGDPAWTCPAAVSAYADIGGSDADIVEFDGSTGKPNHVYKHLRNAARFIRP